MLPDVFKIQVDGRSVILRGDGTAMIPETMTLLVADLHLGKDSSFRKSGIPVPAGINETILNRLLVSATQANAKALWILGDMIHDQNSLTPTLVEEFAKFQLQLDIESVVLIRGNHDRHVPQFPATWNLKVVSSLEQNRIQFRHMVSEQTLAQNNFTQIGGHWHPVTKFGIGADQMRLPCFVVSSRALTLPAFGAFTGGMNFKANKQQRLIPVCDGKLVLTH